jgi:hypothetical protein
MTSPDNIPEEALLAGTPWQVWLAAGLCALCFLVLAWLAWPGIMVLDSFRQFGQAIHHDYNTWHPVFMAVIWSEFNLIRPGPQAFLIANLLLYVSALFLIAQACIRHGLPSAWLICLFGFLPFLSNFAGVLLKDTVLCITWLFGFALLLRAHLSGRRPGVLTAGLLLASLTCGFLVRPFSAPALLPLVALACHVFRGGSWRSRSLWGATLLLFFGICLTAPLVNRLVDARPNSAMPTLLLWDLTGTSINAGVDLFPDYLKNRPGHDLAILKQHYSTTDAALMLHLGSGQETRKTPEQVYRGPHFVSYVARDMQQHVPELLVAWFKALREHPAAYLEHRLAVARSFLRFGYEHGYVYAYYDHWEPDYVEPFVPRRQPAQVLAMRGWIEGVEWVLPVLFKPWFWLALNGLALLLSLSYRGDRRIRQAVLTLASSALFYVSPLMLFTPASDFRYAYWAVWATSLGWGLLLLDMWRQHSFGVGKPCLGAVVLVALLVPTEFLYRHWGALAVVPWFAGAIGFCLWLLVRVAPGPIRQSPQGGAASSSRQPPAEPVKSRRSVTNGSSS